tara:strand:- start:3324 stop:3773 length:450 start_codon:yes stop_codon:yes gene_type:complete
MKTISFKVLDEAPSSARSWFDGPKTVPVPLFARLDGDTLSIKPMERIAVPTGLIAVLPEGIEGQIVAPQNWNEDIGLLILNSPGTIDPDYRGEIKVLLTNITQENIEIKHGELIGRMRIAAFLHPKISEVSSFEDTKRSTSGFGSTGIN